MLKGAFFINARLNRATYTVSLVFSIAQHYRDSLLFDCFVKLLGCGKKYEESNKPVVRFRLEKFSDVFNILIPFFTKYPLIGAWGSAPRRPRC